MNSIKKLGIVSSRNSLSCILVVLCSCTLLSTKASFPFRDSTKVEKSYRLTEQQFLDQYGKDDSTRALIRYYFERRKSARKTGLISASVTGGLGALVIAYSQSSHGFDNISTALLLGVGFCFSGFILLLSGARLLNASRRSLYKLVHAGRKIPKRITGQPLYKKLLQQEKNRK